MAATLNDAYRAMREMFAWPKTDPVKGYLFARSYGASKSRARAVIVESFQPFAKTKRRQIGRAIRKAERQWAQGYCTGGIRSYAEQQSLREGWLLRRPVAPGTSKHEQGTAMDLDLTEHPDIYKSLYPYAQMVISPQPSILGSFHV